MAAGLRPTGQQRIGRLEGNDRKGGGCSPRPDALLGNNVRARRRLAHTVRCPRSLWVATARSRAASILCIPTTLCEL